jgi:hypothetical protein
VRINFIATTYKTQGKKLIFDKYRFFAEGSGNIHDLTTSKILEVLRRGEVQVIGLEEKQGELIGTNGSIERYPKVMIEGNQESAVGGEDNTPVVIISTRGNNQYNICTYFGTYMVVSEEQIVRLKQTRGVANCKLVQRNGKYYLSAIKGRFPELK